MTPMQDDIATHILSLGLEYEVLGVGSPSAQICIIAEYPGDTEVAMKQPLVGSSGLRTTRRDTPPEELGDRPRGFSSSIEGTLNDKQPPWCSRAQYDGVGLCPIGIQHL